MKFTKYIFIFLSFILTLSLISCDVKKEAKLIYQVEKYSCTIMGITKDTEEITIPKLYEGKKVNYIYYNAFSNAKSLKRIYYEGTPEDWLTVANTMVDIIEEIYFLNEEGEYFLFDSYTYNDKIIDFDNVFERFKCFKTLYVTKKVEEIKMGCIGYYSFLEEVYYEGTQEDWSKIKFRCFGVNPMDNAEKIYFLDEYGNYYLVEELYFDVENLDLANYVGFDCLKTLRLSKNVKSIKIGLCQLDNLEKVYFEGSLEEWLNIYYENAFDYLTKYAEEIYVKNEFGEYVLADLTDE